MKQETSPEDLLRSSDRTCQKDVSIMEEKAAHGDDGEFEKRHGDREKICTICLEDISVKDFAVLVPCMHDVYHHRCIERWFGLGHHTCPLCKCSVESWLHNIQGDKEYRETRLDLKFDGSRTESRASILAGAFRLSPAVQGDHTPRANVSTSGSGYVERTNAARHYGANNRRYPNVCRREARNGNGIRDQHDVRPQGRDSYRSNYSLRLQRCLQSTNIDFHSSSLSESLSPVDNQIQTQNRYGNERSDKGALDRRKSIYQCSLWAQPFEGSSSYQPISLIRQSGTRERRISEFIDRDLKAILNLEDIGVLKPFVIGLLSSFGPKVLQHASQSESEATRLSRYEETAPDVINSLEPFLGRAKSAHFWHELSVFVTAPAYTIDTFDRLVRYIPTESSPSNHGSAWPPSESFQPPAFSHRNRERYVSHRHEDRRQSGNSGSYSHSCDQMTVSERQTPRSSHGIRSKYRRSKYRAHRPWNDNRGRITKAPLRNT